MSDHYRLLLVDDDAALARMIAGYLQKSGYDVRTAADSRAAVAALRREPIHLAIVDLGLPGEDGLSLTRRLRQEHALGVIILTGATDLVDRVAGLEAGADDYVTKPVELRELLARVRSVLRRVGSPIAAGEALAPEKRRFLGWTFEMSARQVRHEDGRVVRLTTAEYDLLAALTSHPNQVMSRDRLLDLTRGRDAGPFDRSIDMLVSKLRRKLDTDPANPQTIQTVRGGGYLFASDVTRG